MILARGSIRALGRIAAWEEWRAEQRSSPGVCVCDDPVLVPVGGWLPSSWHVCDTCGRPPLAEVRASVAS